jgi:hypothetical protein
MNNADIKEYLDKTNEKLDKQGESIIEQGKVIVSIQTDLKNQNENIHILLKQQADWVERAITTEKEIIAIKTERRAYAGVASFVGVVIGAIGNALFSSKGG